jgi:hypothetical protein
MAFTQLSLSQFSKFDASIRIPVYMWIGLCLLTAIIMSGRVVAGRQEVQDPYLAVNELFETEGRQVALARGFTCQDYDYASTGADYCYQLTKGQESLNIYLEVSKRTTQEVDVSMPENIYTLGDLILLWGKPETHSYCGTQVAFSWAVHQVTAMVVVRQTRRTNYFAPIEYISFRREALSRWQVALLVGCEVWGGS